MRQQIAVGFAAGHFAKEIEVADSRCEREIQTVANCFHIPREWQVRRRISEIWTMRRQRGGEALDVFMRVRINKIDIEGDRAESPPSHR